MQQRSDKIHLFSRHSLANSRLSTSGCGLESLIFRLQKHAPNGVSMMNTILDVAPKQPRQIARERFPTEARIIMAEDDLDGHERIFNALVQQTAILNATMFKLLSAIIVAILGIAGDIAIRILPKLLE